VDLISGHYTVNRNNPSPFQLNGFESLSVSNTSVFASYMLFILFAAVCNQANQFKLPLIGKKKKTAIQDPRNCTSLLHKVILVYQSCHCTPMIRI
jgi:hypothetical protein